MSLAEVEARELGHDRLGTEHLLLGLLANEGSGAARVLSEAGVTLAAARHKVTEALGRTAPGAAPAGTLPRSARAARALARSVRFSHARRSDLVASEDVLTGVLDVEGTAGQVLRGLGVDVERLRSVVTAPAADSSPADASQVDASVVEEPAPADLEPVPVVVAVCPWCAAPLEEVAYRDMDATGAQGPREVTVFSCGACGGTLGVIPVRH